MAFAHGSVWLTLVWLAATGVMGAWVASASYAVAAEAVPPEKGIIVSTMYNTSGGSALPSPRPLPAMCSRCAQVGVQVDTPAGLVTQYFPAEETFTWSAMIVGVAALIGVVAALSIRSRRLRAEARTGGSRSNS